MAQFNYLKNQENKSQKSKNKIRYILSLKFICYLYIIKVSYSSQITLIINGNSQNSILYGQFTPLPDQVFVNNKEVQPGYSVNTLTSNQNIVIMKWNKEITNCNYMLSDLKNVIEIDISEFDSSKVTTYGENVSLLYYFRKNKFRKFQYIIS